MKLCIHGNDSDNCGRCDIYTGGPSKPVLFGTRSYTKQERENLEDVAAKDYQLSEKEKDVMNRALRRGVDFVTPDERAPQAERRRGEPTTRLLWTFVMFGMAGVAVGMTTQWLIMR
jgi:hypothetical protein